jgi:murein DD-endopeptidase / murein LD-carboxypeptidase
MDAEAIVAAARGCVGARFRPWGRDPVLGLDCVGLVAFACGVAAPRDYALRGGDVDRAGAALAAAGLRAIGSEGAVAGDVILIGEGAGQLHLAVLTPTGFVHADAKLRRVVETPGRPANILGFWRKGH